MAELSNPCPAINPGKKCWSWKTPHRNTSSEVMGKGKTLSRGRRLTEAESSGRKTAQVPMGGRGLYPAREPLLNPNLFS